MLSIFSLALSLFTHSAVAQHVHSEHEHTHPGAEEADVAPQEEVAAADLAETEASTGHTGALIIASDRGFLGNEEIRDAVAEFVAASNAHAELVLVTGEETRARLDDAIGAFHERQIHEIVVLPLFLSDDNPRLSAAREMLSDYEGIVKQQKSTNYSASSWGNVRWV